MMHIQDKVYGTFDLTEPVLIELIKSPTLQRLKGVSQQGMPREFWHREVFSRFDHSIGVFLLLRKLGADLNEQIAGLLHDISHTAFSHVIDWVIGDPTKEDHQDKLFLQVLKNSEIPAILKKYHLEVEKIADLNSFSLLEKEAPGLCADRIDYTLRELVDLGYQVEVQQIVDHLVSYQGQIVFKTKEVALEFGKFYAMLQKEHWGGDEAKARYHILAEVLKTAIHEQFLKIEDFSKTDHEILEVLSKTGHLEILEGLRKLKHGFSIKESSEGKGIFLQKKLRRIDPEVLDRGEIKPLSTISEEYQKSLLHEIEHSKRMVYIEIK